MAEQGGIWRNMAEHGKTYMSKYGGTWRNMAEHGGTWQNMVEHGGTRRNMAEHEGIWQKMAKHCETLQKIEEYGKTWKTICIYIYFLFFFISCFFTVVVAVVESPRIWGDMVESLKNPVYKRTDRGFLGCLEILSDLTMCSNWIMRSFTLDFTQCNDLISILLYVYFKCYFTFHCR